MADSHLIDFDLAPREFRERHLEKVPRLQKGAVSGAPFAWSELDAALHRIEPVAPIFQVFNGGLVAEEQYTDLVSELGAPRRRFDKRRFYEQMRKGATLVVNGFERYSIRGMRLCNDVRRFSGWPTVGNAYLSVGGRGTFGEHWDTHDVFAVQLVGRKRWQIFPPTFPLPLGMHRSEGSGYACPAAPLLDCVLEAGDVLYVPRGWWHHAIPFDEPSLHLSVGTYGPTVHDYVLCVCARQLPATLAARRSMTAGLDRGEIDAVLRSLRDVALADAPRAEFEREIASAAKPSPELDTELAFAAGVDALKGGAILRVNSPEPPDPERAEIRVNGGRLRLHPLSRSIVATLGADALPIERLYERLSHDSPDAIRAAVLDLARHEVLDIELGAGC